MSRWSFPMLCCHQESRRSLLHPVSHWAFPHAVLTSGVQAVSPTPHVSLGLSSCCVVIRSPGGLSYTPCLVGPFPMLCCHQESRRSLPHPTSPWVSPSFPLLPGLCRPSSHLVGIFPLVLFQPGARRISSTSPWDISPRSLSSSGPGNLLHVSLPLTLLAPCVKRPRQRLLLVLGSSAVLYYRYVQRPQQRFHGSPPRSLAIKGLSDHPHVSVGLQFILSPSSPVSSTTSLWVFRSVCCRHESK